MKKFALLVVSLFVAGSASYAHKPAPVIPDFIHAAYSVESLLSEAELTNPGVRCLPVHLPDGYARLGRAGFRPAAGCRRRLCHAVRLPEAGRQDGARAVHDRKGACRRGQDTVVLRRAAGVPSPAGESGSDRQVCRVYGAPGQEKTVTTASTWTGRSRWTRSCMPA